MPGIITPEDRKVYGQTGQGASVPLPVRAQGGDQVVQLLGRRVQAAGLGRTQHQTHANRAIETIMTAA